VYVLLQSLQVFTLRWAAGALSNMAFVDEVKHEIFRAGGIHPLLVRSEDADSDLAAFACSALASLAEQPELQVCGVQNLVD
jgi:hypothetical protein